MDASKWKSIAVSHEIYEAIRQLAEQNERSISKQVAYMLKKSIKKTAA